MAGFSQERPVSSLAIVGSSPTWPPFACEVGRRDLITLLGGVVAGAAGGLLRRCIYFPPPGLSYSARRISAVEGLSFRRHSRHEMSYISSPSVRPSRPDATTPTPPTFDCQDPVQPFQLRLLEFLPYSGQPVTPQPLTDAEYNRFGVIFSIVFQGKTR